jgi:hypothetical protein
LPAAGIDWIAFSDDHETMLTVGDDRVLRVVTRSDGRVLAEMGKGQGIDWAAVRTVPIQSSPIKPDRVPPSASVSYPDSALKVVRMLEAAGHTWVVVQQSALNHSTYLIDGDRALTYPGLALKVTAIEQHVQLLWLKGASNAGSLVRIEGADLIFYPAKGVPLNGVVAYHGKDFLMTRSGGLFHDRRGACARQQGDRLGSGPIVNSRTGYGLPPRRAPMC